MPVPPRRPRPRGGVTGGMAGPLDAVASFEHRPVEGDDGAAALVVLHGWTGSSPGALRKYAAAWNEAGCETLATCPGVSQLWRPGSVASLCEALCDALAAELAARPRPLLLHFFSGAVTVFLAHLVTGLERRREGAGGAADWRLRDRLAGVIFDSCPVEYTRQSGLAAARQMREQGALPAAATPLVVAGGVVMEWWSGARIRAELTESLRAPCMQVPALFLFADQGDDVAPAAAVRRWAAEHAARGNRCSRVCFPSSEHVSHLRHHPDRYRHELKHFLGSVCGGMTAKL